MTELTLTELLCAQAMVLVDIDDATSAIGCYEAYPQKSTWPAAKEARRRLPELRKTEALMVARIRALLAPAT